MVTKIKVKSPVVDLLGDEMTAIMWGRIKKELLMPYLEMDLKVYDLGVQSRDKTDDQVTMDAAYAIREHGVGVKCATITPDEARVEEFGLKKMWRSPNGTIRNILGGTIFREPIIIKGLKRFVPSFTKSVIIARHAFGDQYRAVDKKFLDRPGKLAMKFTPADGGKIMEFEVCDLKSGVGMVMFNEEESIRGFARDSMSYALMRKIPLFFTTKNTILKNYDGLFKDIFQEVYEKEFKKDFEKLDLFYEHKLIDDMVATILRSNGGFLWACKNYDGDVQSDFLAQAYHGLGLMTSVLMADGGKIVETEAAHGTVTRHYRDHQAGKKTSTNPVASIFAWTRGLWFRGKNDKQKEVVDFALKLEDACVKCMQDGVLSKDMMPLAMNPNAKLSTTDEILDAIRDNLQNALR